MISFIEFGCVYPDPVKTAAKRTTVKNLVVFPVRRDFTSFNILFSTFGDG
ncbi:MAG: hypothetical protein WBN42_07890 [Ignavibacteriaceae bacterium]